LSCHRISIWIAHDTDLNRDVALKEIKSSTVPDSESWRRFLKEAQITGRLEHPNIVPVYEPQRRIASTNATRALRNLRLAQDAADGLLGEVADVDLADIPQMEPVRQRLLEKARAGYQQFLVQEDDDPRVRWGAVRAQVRLGDIQALQGDDRKAEASYRVAAGELENLAKQDPSNVDIRRDLARAVHGLGRMLGGDQGDAKLREALRLREDILRLPDATADVQQAAVDSRYRLGALMAGSGAADSEAYLLYKIATAVQAHLVKQFGDRPDYLTKLVRYRNNLAILQRAMGSSSESEATLRGSLDLVAPLVKGPDPLPGARWQLSRVSNSSSGRTLDPVRHGIAGHGGRTETGGRHPRASRRHRSSRDRSQSDHEEDPRRSGF